MIQKNGKKILDLEDKGKNEKQKSKNNREESNSDE